jgi:hypothetical protein
MVVYHCCGCRAQYPAQPKRCPRCKGRSFSAINDDAPTAQLLDAGSPLGTPPENLDDELRAAFAASERHRLTALGQAVPAWAAEPPPAVVLEGDDAPPTPRDMPERGDEA